MATEQTVPNLGDGIRASIPVVPVALPTDGLRCMFCVVLLCANVLAAIEPDKRKLSIEPDKRKLP